MRISKLAAAALLGVAALGLNACANSLDTEVSRYQAMPAPQGQTFIVVPGDGMAANGGLEFQRYAAARGYTPATDPKSASMVVQFGYGVDRGQVRYVDDPFGYGGYGSRFYDPFYNPFYYPRYGFRSPFYYGWDDPFWYGRGMDSYVEYHGQIDLHIRSSGTHQPLFDGRAQARSTTNRLDVVLPSLIEAMFTGFPGRSGENVKITIPTPRPAS
jgi:hypothetical protein